MSVLSALHVGVHEGLYRELIPMIDSVAASLDFMKVWGVSQAYVTIQENISV